MTNIKQKFCKLKKSDIEEHKKELIDIIKKPKYICTSCARCSCDKKYLCKPEKIKKREE